MKKKLSIIVIAVCMATGLTACGGKDEVNVITKEVSNESSGMSEEQEQGKSEDDSGLVDDNQQDSSELADDNSMDNSSDENKVDSSDLQGYIFKTDGLSGTVSMTADIDSEPVIKALGEPESYFEAPSCAFQGIDKIYTYAHFEINTYQEGGKDKISMILFKDDLVSTTEGIYIGMTKEDMERAYGTDYEMINASCIYKKDNMKLVFILTDGTISYIEYSSMKLD